MSAAFFNGLLGQRAAHPVAFRQSPGRGAALTGRAHRVSA